MFHAGEAETRGRAWKQVGYDVFGLQAALPHMQSTPTLPSAFRIPENRGT